MTKKIKRFYLAHPLLSRHRTRRWELYMEKKYGIILENPFYDKEGPGGRTDTIATDNFKKVKKSKDYDEILVSNDLKLIGSCAAIVAIVDGVPSYGTIMEIVYASLMKKSIYVICINGYEDHPWLDVHADIIFKSFKEFEEFLKNNLI